MYEIDGVAILHSSPIPKRNTSEGGRIIPDLIKDFII